MTQPPDRDPQPGDSPFAPPPDGDLAGWQHPPDPPPSRVKRFSGVFVMLGMLAVLPLSLGLGYGAASVLMRLSGELGIGGVGGLGAAGASISPIVVGIVLAVVARSPRWRGFGLGLAAGWAAWLIIGAGLCVALFMGYGVVGSFGG